MKQSGDIRCCDEHSNESPREPLFEMLLCSRMMNFIMPKSNSML